MKDIVGILGFGEVGRAIKQLINKKYRVLARDLNFDEIGSQKLSVLHVCIPDGKNFIKHVVEITEETKPELIIINSTVVPGTTERIFQKTKIDTIHSPFMGVHPAKPKGQFVHGEGMDLYDYFVKFPKMIGPTTKTSSSKAKFHFESVGLKVEIFDSAKDTEFAKILCTTYYGWNIIFEKWVHQLCLENNLNFEQVYTQYNTFYNQGYGQNLPHVTRPVLKHHDGEIGGHCVIPNANLLQDAIKDDFTKFLLTQNKKLGKTKQNG